MYHNDYLWRHFRSTLKVTCRSNSIDMERRVMHLMQTGIGNGGTASSTMNGLPVTHLSTVDIGQQATLLILQRIYHELKVLSTAPWVNHYFPLLFSWFNHVTALWSHFFVQLHPVRNQLKQTLKKKIDFLWMVFLDIWLQRYKNMSPSFNEKWKEKIWKNFYRRWKLHIMSRKLFQSVVFKLF